MRLLPLVSLLLMSGCGSYWDLRAGEELSLSCDTLLLYFPDDDGDGWGIAGSEGVPLCEADESEDPPLTATNARDCDDLDAEITGDVGERCPADLYEVVDYAGFVRGESEYVVVFGDSAPLGSVFAEAECVAWAGQPVEGAGGGHRGLAVLETEDELAQVTTWLSETLPPNTAVFVGIEYTGEMPVVGVPESPAWAWLDGSVATLNQLQPCSGTEVNLADANPSLIWESSEAQSSFEAAIETTRLVMRLEGGAWCRDVVREDPTMGYEAEHAHYLCERPKPDLAEYQEDLSQEEKAN